MRVSTLLAALVLPLSASSTSAQVAVGQLRITAPVAIGGWVAYIYLPAGGIQPVVTPSSAAACGYSPAVKLLDTPRFAAEHHAFVAITANAGKALDHYVEEKCEGTVTGLIVSDGMLVNAPEPRGPALYFPTGRTRAVISDSLPPLTTIRNAVAGTTTIGDDCPGNAPGTLLVARGTPGACALPKPFIRAARGAAGVDKTGTVLILAIVQGVEDSTGLTTAELSRLMISLGAWNAVNFDGGGSTAFIWTGANAPTERRVLRQLARPGSSGEVQYAVTWKSPRGNYHSNALCDSCSVYRAVYAAIGLRKVRLPR